MARILSLPGLARASGGDARRRDSLGATSGPNPHRFQHGNGRLPLTKRSSLVALWYGIASKQSAKPELALTYRPRSSSFAMVVPRDGGGLTLESQDTGTSSRSKVPRVVVIKLEKRCRNKQVIRRTGQVGNISQSTLKSGGLSSVTNKSLRERT